MATKYVITFSNCTENGVKTPEKLFNLTAIQFVTTEVARTAAKVGYDLNNCTAYPVNGMYKEASETSFRLEYITQVSPLTMVLYCNWIRKVYEQESVLLETYNNDGYKAELIYDLDKIVEL